MLHPKKVFYGVAWGGGFDTPEQLPFQAVSCIERFMEPGAPAQERTRKERNRDSANKSRQNARRADPDGFRLKRARWERNRPGNKTKQARQAAATAAMQPDVSGAERGTASGAMGGRSNGVASGAANGVPMPAQVAGAAIDPLQRGMALMADFFLGMAGAAIAAAQACGSSGSGISSDCDGRLAGFFQAVQVPPRPQPAMVSPAMVPPAMVLPAQPLPTIFVGEPLSQACARTHLHPTARAVPLPTAASPSAAAPGAAMGTMPEQQQQHQRQRLREQPSGERGDPSAIAQAAAAVAAAEAMLRPAGAAAAASASTAAAARAVPPRVYARRGASDVVLFACCGQPKPPASPYGVDPHWHACSVCECPIHGPVACESVIVSADDERVLFCSDTCAESV